MTVIPCVIQAQVAAVSTSLTDHGLSIAGIAHSNFCSGMDACPYRAVLCRQRYCDGSSNEPYQISKMMRSFISRSWTWKRTEALIRKRRSRRGRKSYPYLINNHTMKTYEWRHSSMHSEPQHTMQMNGLLQSPAALSSKRDIPAPTLFYLPVYFNKQFLSSTVNSLYVAVSSFLKLWRWPCEGYKHVWSHVNCLRANHLKIYTVLSRFTV
jgi:hypothetical protein